MPALTPPPTGMSHDIVLSLVISVATGLLLLVGWFLVRTLTQVEKALDAGRAETAALRTELGNVKSDLKDYAGQVKSQSEEMQRQSAELSGLKKAYTALLNAYTALDKWLYGQAVQGKLPMPPPFKASTFD
jgi:hypothetical protein